MDKDANGVSIDEGLKAKGTYFNFTPLAEANRTTFNNEIEIERKDYPLFEKTGEEATINTAKTQRTADSSKPTIGIFEKAMDENA